MTTGHTGCQGYSCPLNQPNELRENLCFPPSCNTIIPPVPLASHLQHEGELGVPEGNVAFILGQSGDHIPESAEATINILSLPDEAKPEE